MGLISWFKIRRLQKQQRRLKEEVERLGRDHDRASDDYRSAVRSGQNGVLEMILANRLSFEFGSRSNDLRDINKELERLKK